MDVGAGDRITTLIIPFGKELNQSKDGGQEDDGDQDDQQVDSYIKVHISSAISIG